MSGKLISNIANEKVQSGIYSKQLLISNMPNGLYFINIVSNSGTSTLKVIKQ